MQRGISYQGFLPVRREPSHGAGMISQVLFGETFTILKSEGAWLFIEIDSDHDPAWVDRNGISMLKEDEPPGIKGQGKEVMVTLPFVKVEDRDHDRQLLLPAGSVLRNERRFKKLSEEGWIVPGDHIDPEEVGRGLLSIPGLEGGRCGFGFDAPGLVQLLCRCMGIHVPHSISGQARPGSVLNFIHEASKGDLAFFRGEDENFNHVGMVLDDGKIIHVSDQVRIDSLDQQGIYCKEKQRYTHRLSIIRSLKS